MTRLPLALIWLLSMVAGAVPGTRGAGEWRSQASILAADPIPVPSAFRPVRIELAQAGAPARHCPWRHAVLHAELAAGRRYSSLLAAARIERSSRRLTFLVPASRLGTPRFPTGPPAA